MSGEIAAGAKAAEAAIELVKLAHKQGWLDKLKAAFRKKHRVLVLGATGTGKTNFLESLSELVPQAIHNMNRTEFAEKHAIRIVKEPFIFVDTPGDLPLKDRRISAIRDAMKTDLAGVINVVSYGYHEYRIGKRGPIKDGSINEEFLEKHREEEIKALNEWTMLLGGRETADWLITVVTKADLWWDRHDEVMAHYRSGPYAEALGEAKSLRPNVLEYCSVFHKFYGEGAMSGVFDEEDRIRTRANLLRVLLTAISEGNG